ncbi:uridylate-specific endoribonuclease B-like [Ptychodera flava]|uniref:uridylate-specific endoribonuclease B-like n=1 Tax=Ptychodera flava TaxID=63121 RepID=UPI00396A8EB2
MADGRNTDLSEIISKLWELDENQLTPGEDFSIDLQGKTKVYNDGRQDKASDPLFSFVKESVFKRETYKNFVALLDNYEQETGLQEEVTEEEFRENCRFIDSIMKTKVMKEAHKFLVSKGASPRDEQAFKRQLYDIWFKLYRRTKGVRNSDSSGFEHVFVGETRSGTDDVMGFHNWIQFYLQEKHGNIDYKGWIPPRGRRSHRPIDNPRLISVQFSWKQDVKAVGSTFIGTSPEFEIALYTICFLCGEDSNLIEVEDYTFEIVAHRWGKILASCYPVMK